MNIIMKEFAAFLDASEDALIILVLELKLPLNFVCFYVFLTFQGVFAPRLSFFDINCNRINLINWLIEIYLFNHNSKFLNRSWLRSNW